MQKLKIAVITLNGTFPEVLDNKLSDEGYKDVKTFDKKNFFFNLQTNLQSKTNQMTRPCPRLEFKICSD